MLGIGPPVFKLKDPQNPETGGITVSHFSVPPSGDDPFWCGWDPKTGTQHRRSITFDITCDPNGNFGESTPFVARVWCSLSCFAERCECDRFPCVYVFLLLFQLTFTMPSRTPQSSATTQSSLRQGTGAAAHRCAPARTAAPTVASGTAAPRSTACALPTTTAKTTAFVRARFPTPCCCRCRSCPCCRSPVTADVAASCRRRLPPGLLRAGLWRRRVRASVRHQQRRLPRGRIVRQGAVFAQHLHADASTHQVQELCVGKGGGVLRFGRFGCVVCFGCCARRIVSHSRIVCLFSLSCFSWKHNSRRFLWWPHLRSCCGRHRHLVVPAPRRRLVHSLFHHRKCCSVQQLSCRRRAGPRRRRLRRSVDHPVVGWLPLVLVSLGFFFNSTRYAK